ncbi:nitrous oxide reductase accessory protein NosL [Shouchella sp. 1P09AA]|uniref:nitrous oxide reductase accessory protein NosL n=1 Tax=unclassified Shouchella TaxID=2893065 RepID=UPI0039A36F2A
MKKRMIATVLLGLALSACNHVSTDAHDIHDVDTCIICNMGIHNVQAATQIVMEDGTAEKFDDIGCLVQFMIENPDLAPTFHTAYANGYDTQEWFDMTEGAFVYHKDIVTPMGNGVISFSTVEAAESYVEMYEPGEIILYDELEAHDWNSF